ncbi:hypothetical protein BDZ89DRAFT_1074593 [Hymenopellis radicata]|nr:hypothetical protein BDZ89DRAFT_1074593 [Hymenopellis radicata]
MRRVLITGTRNVHTTGPAPKESWKQKFKNHPKTVIGLTGYYQRRQGWRDENHPRIILAGLTARTFWHIDQTLFASTDFSSFESTMAYFKVCVLVSSWVMQERHTYAAPRNPIIQAEDIATLRDRDKIEAKFAALLAMPEGQTKALYHSKVRLALMSCVTRI